MFQQVPIDTTKKICGIYFVDLPPILLKTSNIPSSAWIVTKFRKKVRQDPILKRSECRVRLIGRHFSDLSKDPSQMLGVTREARHSHSIVPGGLLVMSYVTRLIPRTSLMMRVAARPKKAMSNGKKSAVMPSLDVTARRAQTLS